MIERQGIVVHLIAHGVRAVQPHLDGARGQMALPFSSRDFH